MPIVDIELVTAADAQDGLSGERLRNLADGLGKILDSPPTGTWVRVRYLPESCYAENLQRQPEYPVFVTILKAQLQPADQLAEEVRKITESVAGTLGRPAANVHVVYQPKAAGRIAFGGNLRRE